MKLKSGLMLLLVLPIFIFSFANVILLDDFEGDISKETVDYGEGNGTQVQVSFSQDIKYSGKQSLKVEYNSVPSGYMWVARGYNLDVEGAAQWLKPPKKIRWKKYKAISFYFYGEGKGVTIAFDIKDAQKEMWRYMFEDDTEGWKKVVCEFDKFFARSDWQPSDAEADGVLDFPIMSFQWEVRTPAKGVIYFDKVEINAKL